ncbi:Family S53 protease-like protein [Mycena venus]|uniref:tripeptidyl-peptidase II n=1 Tax=Mycena venus TaxID=2733690 RepID=A0A8H6YWX6_9AGAR|nr:Family S53 protease-like protein [Mycena venus]
MKGGPFPRHPMRYSRGGAVTSHIPYRADKPLTAEDTEQFRCGIERCLKSVKNAGPEGRVAKVASLINGTTPANFTSQNPELLRSMTFHRLRLLISLTVVAAVSAERMVLHEQRAAPPAGFTSQGAAPANEIITLRVALTSNNVKGLQDKLMSVSTPGGPDFRQWLSMEDARAFMSFASANGLNFSAISPNEDWFSVTLPISQANSLFAANFEKFTNPKMKTALTRTLSVSLPEELFGHVEVLHPTTAFDGPATRPRLASGNQSRRAVPPDSCMGPGNTITPACLQALYGIPTTPATQTSSTLFVTGYTEQWAQRADLMNFLKAFRPDIPPNTTYALKTLDGGSDPQQAFDLDIIEANIDIQYTVGLATGVPVTFLSVGDDETEEAFFTQLLDTTTYLAGAANPPTTITTSYGSNEVDFGSSLATKICNGYMALGARGVSVLFASGDGGVRGGHDDETQCNNNTFIPVFPATCPFVTSVGATINFNPEIAEPFSSGGFSNFFPAPSYQSTAVAAYLKSLPSDFPGIFNSSGRGFPDVAFQGSPFAIVFNNKTDGFDGTSCSSPGFTSVIALINDRLVADGKPVLGFLNPWLYGNAGALTDITIGHNSGDACENSTFSGFDAAAGWDPLTGLGTPIFDKLLSAAMA